MDFLNSDGGKQLLTKLKKGDVHAFEQVYDLINQPLYSFVYRYIKSKEETEEIVQDVFIQLWTVKENIREDHSFKSFVFTITKNRIMDYFRKQKIRVLYNSYIRNYTEYLSDNIHQDLILKDLDSLLAQVVHKLPEKRRIVFLLSKKFGMSRSEIAEFMNISENTVRNQLQEAMDFIRRSIKNEVLLLPFLILNIIS